MNGGAAGALRRAPGPPEPSGHDLAGAPRSAAGAPPPPRRPRSTGRLAEERARDQERRPGAEEHREPDGEGHVHRPLEGQRPIQID
jgi:hypothetical protein